jgi:hypothetical protein
MRTECGASADNAPAANMARILGLIFVPSLRVERIEATGRSIAGGLN